MQVLLATCPNRDHWGCVHTPDPKETTLRLANKAGLEQGVHRKAIIDLGKTCVIAKRCIGRITFDLSRTAPCFHEKASKNM